MKIKKKKKKCVTASTYSQDHRLTILNINYSILWEINAIIILQIDFRVNSNKLYFFVLFPRQSSTKIHMECHVHALVYQTKTNIQYYTMTYKYQFRFDLSFMCTDLIFFSVQNFLLHNSLSLSLSLIIYYFTG